MQEVRSIARSLLAEAQRTNERRMLVLAGARFRCIQATEALTTVLSGDGVTIGPKPIFGTHISVEETGSILGQSFPFVIFDGHAAARPNIIGHTVGTIEGGGLLVMLVPPFSQWPTQRTQFEDAMAAPPFTPSDVTGHFREHLIETVLAHPGITVFDVDSQLIRSDGRTDPPPKLKDQSKQANLRDDLSEGRFPSHLFIHCLTADQRQAVSAGATMGEHETVVLTAHRGRGKSAAAGLIAAGYAKEGKTVTVTAPDANAVHEVFERAAVVLDDLGALSNDYRTGSECLMLRTTSGGAITYQSPIAAIETDPDVLIVDEAAGLPVRMLKQLINIAPRCCFATTTHGYEGVGRGFSVRFQSHLTETTDTTTIRLTEPIRYAAGDPLESWQFRTLLLDARPPAAVLVDSATLEEVTYEPVTSTQLRSDEPFFRELFGTLVDAHYRTEPDDLARLLDAPNIGLRVLTYAGHIVAVAMVALEGSLDTDMQEAMYTGDRVRGNMIPDILTSHLRDENAGSLQGLRIIRIATHPSLRGQGFGSTLLHRLRQEAASGFSVPSLDNSVSIDWLGAVFGATPRLVSFWSMNHYQPITLAVTRNDRSGEYSIMMLNPVSEPGDALVTSHAEALLTRIPDMLADPLQDADPAVIRATLTACDPDPTRSLTTLEWKYIVSAAHGPGLFEFSPRPFRTLALRALSDGVPENDRQSAVLVQKALQLRSWETVTEEGTFESIRSTKQAFGTIYQELLDLYGPTSIQDEIRRLQ